jgi:CxxC motif-containing protein
MNRTITCVSCPNGCTLLIALSGGKVKSVTGNACKRGIEYAKNEMEDPRRMLTTTVKVANGAHALLPVRTGKPVPKALLRECMAAINGLTVNAPVEMGETVLPDILHTGVDIVAARPVARA